MDGKMAFGNFCFQKLVPSKWQDSYIQTSFEKKKKKRSQRGSFAIKKQTHPHKKPKKAPKKN